MKTTTRHNFETMAIMIRRITDYPYMSSTELAGLIGLEGAAINSFVKCYRLQLERMKLIEPRSPLTLHQIKGYRTLMKYLDDHPGEHYIGELMRLPSASGGRRQHIAKEIAVYRKAKLPFPIERIKYDSLPKERRLSPRPLEGMRWVKIKECDPEHLLSYLALHRQWHHLDRKSEARHAA